MTKKEAQKIFSDMVRDARKVIDGSNIDTVSIGIHRVDASKLPKGFSQPSHSHNLALRRKGYTESARTHSYMSPSIDVYLI